MTKYFLFVAAGLISTAGFAQDIKEVQTLAITGQYAKAKEAVDKHLEVPKNAQKPQGWYYKGFIYKFALLF